MAVHQQDPAALVGGMRERDTYCCPSQWCQCREKTADMLTRVDQIILCLQELLKLQLFRRYYYCAM